MKSTLVTFNSPCLVLLTVQHVIAMAWRAKIKVLRLLGAQLTFINSVQSVICEIFLLHWIGCDWKLLVRKALTIKNLDGVDQQKVISAIEGCNFRGPIVIDAERYFLL